MLFSWKLLRLVALAAVVCLPVEGARPPYPSPEDQIHRRVCEAREKAGSSALERRADLDALARERAVEIAARPADERRGEMAPLGEVLKERGGLFRRALERRILFRNMNQVTGVMEKWEAQSQAWKTVTTSDLDGVGYGTARGDDGWIVFIAILVQDLDIRNSPVEISAMEQAVLEEVNRIRKDHGLGELRPLEALADAGRAHCRNMVDSGFFSHSDPSGSRPVDRVREAKIKFKGVAENITMNNNPDTPAVQAVRDWMDSPGHRKNILDGDFQITGVGAAVSADGHYYFVQLFVVP